MGTEPLERKLVAILYADVAGYSRLTGADEEGTHRLLSTYLDAITNLIEEHNGKVLHFAGDAVLAEFASLVNALTCAVAIQHDLKARNQDLPDERKLQFRIGINLGDVIVDRDEIYGDGVNVAARLESLAEPGGICISDMVRQGVEGKLDLVFEDLGEQQVKNIDQPVRAYRAQLKPGATLPAPTVRAKPRRPMRHLIAATAAGVVLIIGVITWWQPWQTREEPASVERMAFPLPDKPSIAVLPFANMSDDPKQEYFVDGMTEDLITDLSKLSGLFVIARNSVFTYKGKPVKVRQVAEELGVRYVLEGSVRRADSQVRINAQLIDATTGGHLWAERYDGSLDNVFAMQDEVTQKIVTALAVTLTAADTTRYVDDKPNSPEAYDAFLRGWANYQLHGPDDLAKAVPHFEKAVDLEPGYSNAHAALAAVYWESWDNGWVESLKTSFFRALKQARTHLKAAMKNPTPLAHWVASNSLASQGEYEQAVREAERAITLDPNSATGYAALANAQILAGKAAEGIDSIQTAMRLDPLHPGYLITLGQAQFTLERFKDAAVTLERAVQRNPKNEWAWVFLASTYGHLDRAQDGQAAVGSYNELRIQQGLPELMLEHLDYWGIGRGTYRDRVLAGLTKVPAPKWRALITGGPGAGFEIKGVTTIDPATAKILHERGALFVNLCSYMQDWIAGHIPGAVRLEPARVGRATLGKIANKDQELVFYCGVPASAPEAAAKAFTWGYKNVYHFPEGTTGWRVAGYPMQKGE